MTIIKPLDLQNQRKKPTFLTSRLFKGRLYKSSGGKNTLISVPCPNSD